VREKATQDSLRGARKGGRLFSGTKAKKIKSILIKGKDLIQRGGKEGTENGRAAVLRKEKKGIENVEELGSSISQFNIGPKRVRITAAIKATKGAFGEKGFSPYE